MVEIEIEDVEEYQPLKFNVKKMKGDRGSVESILTVLSDLLKQTQRGSKFTLKMELNEELRELEENK